MLGFTIPLLAIAGAEGLVALWLLLPIPVARPAIWLCKQTQSQVGRTVLTTVSIFLLILSSAPVSVSLTALQAKLYDLFSLHQVKYDSKNTEINASEARETEATSNLSAILTISGLVTMFVVRRLGLALGEIDENGGWKVTIPKVDPGKIE